MDAYVIGWFRFALDVALKATVLFALAGVALLLLRRRSASARHVVAALAFGAVLLVPVFTSVLPRVPVPLFPMPVAAASARGSTGIPAAVVEWEVLDSTPRQSAGIAPEIRAITESAPVSAGPIRRIPDANISRPFAAGIVLPVGGMAALLTLWAAGTAALLARLAIGLARVRRCRSAAGRLDSPEWKSLARRLGRSLGLREDVEMFVTPELPVAVTAGLRHPVLLLPESARNWDEGRRRIVLLHELAHVARRDWLALLIARAVVAVYWFHPLAWILARRLRRDGERAADDRVLALGTKPSVYAGHLLGIIRSLKPAASRQLLPVMGMARPSHFEERLRAILDPGLLRRKMSRGQVQLMAVFLLAFAGAIAALQPWGPACQIGRAVAPALRASATHDRSNCPLANRSSGSVPKAAPARRMETRAAVPPARISSDALAESPAPAAGDAEGFVKASRRVADPGRVEYHDGREFHADGRYLEAAQAFRRAYEAGYRKPESAYNAACAWARAGKPDQAFEWLEKASAEGFRSSAHIADDEDLASLRSDPRLSGVLQRLGRTELDSARRSPEGLAAVERFEELSKSSPERGEEFYASGRELLHVGRYDLAERAFRLSARRGYRAGTSLYNAACALSLEGKRAEAMDLLQQALEAGFDDPKLVRTDEDLAAIRSEAKFQQLAQMSEALHLRADGKSFLGFDRRRDRAAWQQAAARYEEYASAHPRLGRAWFNAGFARLAGGDAPAAARAFERSVALDYRRPTSLYDLACSYARLGRKDEAFDRLFQALDAGFDQAGTIADDEDLASLHGDPRFRKALRASRDGTRSVQ